MHLFTEMKTDVTNENISWIDVRPTNVIDKNTEVVDFFIPKNTNVFWDLSRSYMEITAKVVNKDDSTMVSDLKVGVINSLGSTMWRTVETTINQYQFGSNPNLYHLQCYLENLLTTTQDAKNSYMQSQLWFVDSPGLLNISDPEQGNEGYKQRYEFTRGSQQFKMAVPIHHDLFMQPKYLLSGCELGLRMYRANDKFILMNGEATGEPKLTLIDMNLKLCQITPSMEVASHIEKHLHSKPAIYNIYQTAMHKFTVPTASPSFTVDNLYPAMKLPDIVVVAFFKVDNVNGNYKNSPLDMSHHSVSSIGLYVDSIPTPQRPYKLNFAALEAMDGYMSIFNQFNLFGSDKSNHFGINAYIQQFTCYAFSLTRSASGNSSNTNAEGRQGVVKIEVAFAKPTGEQLYMVVMSKTAAILSLDKSRQISIT